MRTIERCRGCPIEMRTSNRWPTNVARFRSGRRNEGADCRLALQRRTWACRDSGVSRFALLRAASKISSGRPTSLTVSSPSLRSAVPSSLPKKSLKHSVAQSRSSTQASSTRVEIAVWPHSTDASHETRWSRSQLARNSCDVSCPSSTTAPTVRAALCRDADSRSRSPLPSEEARSGSTPRVTPMTRNPEPARYGPPHSL